VKEIVVPMAKTPRVKRKVLVDSTWHLDPAADPASVKRSLKFSLTDRQILRLLCAGGQRNLYPYIKPWRTPMTNTADILARLAPAVLAAAATAASFLLLQFALLVA
jgi:hypothetical protein